MLAAVLDGDGPPAAIDTLRWTDRRFAAQAAHSPVDPAAPPQAQRRITEALAGFVVTACGICANCVMPSPKRSRLLAARA